MKPVFALLVACLLPLALRAADAADQAVRALMEQHRIPGLSVAVLRAGQPAHVRSYGVANLEWNTPVTERTLFEIGSLTKQFTAAAILLLQQDGRLSVEDALSRHLPDAPAAWSNITVRHLLTHTSGLKNYTGLDGFEARLKLNQKQFIQKLAAQPPDFTPGTQAKYCNSGYNLLGYIIENASGRDYWGFLAARIFAPLGMSTATNRDPSFVLRERAQGYLLQGTNWIHRDSDLTDVFAAGAVAASITDLVKWNAMVEGAGLLDARSRAQWWTAQRLTNGDATPYGFGWRLDPYQGHRNIGHSGSTSGFSASLQRFPDDGVTVIVLGNSGELNIATTVARAVAKIYFRAKPDADGGQ
jgi:CubicO group peptidase (beta-lactamase class C family)